MSRHLKCLIGFLLPLVGCSTANYPVSGHFDGTKFHNINKVEVSKNIFDVTDVILMDFEQWPEWVHDNQKPQIQKTVSENEAYVTSINHATHLIQVKGVNILTDPVFSKRIGPKTLQFMGPKRHRTVGIEVDDLPHIHVVLISHNHYDHMDIPSLKKIDEKFKPLFIVPLGNQQMLHSAHLAQVLELDWWNQYEVSQNGKTRIHFTPSQHWSGRGFFDHSRSLWGSFVVQTEKLKIYFAGDTGYGPHFKLIQERFGTFDAAIIPIGAYEPRWFMKNQHLNPEDAVQAHLDLNSRFSIGTHFGTFQLTAEKMEAPVEELSKALKKYGLPQDVFIAPKNGQTYKVVSELWPLK